MDFKARFEKLAPDVLATLSRFPLAVAMLAGATAILVAAMNSWIPPDNEDWGRLAIGLATGAIYATAGVLFAENRPTDRAPRITLAYVVPLIAVLLLQVRDTHWFVPYGLPFIGVLWMSVAGFTRIGKGEERAEIENRFWWFNHQAFATAIIAAVGFGLIGLGISAIERSVAMLFGFESGSVFYMFVLPIIGAFFTPLYWLSTVPKQSEYDPKTLIEPDFLSRAIGFLGQFILTPLLLAYAMILLAYTVQIIGLRQMPQGMLGWMVLGFTLTGAATWLVLHPPFMRSRGLVRIFRRYWFWLTIIPLVLYAIAVWTRIDAYGLTNQRILLIAAGLWAASLTAIYLTGRGDIRLIPTLAAIALFFATVGPWNLENGPKLNQAARLDAALDAAGLTPKAIAPAWTPELAAKVKSSLDFLAYNKGGEHLAKVLPKHGIPYADDGRSLDEARAQLKLPSYDADYLPPEQQPFTSYRLTQNTVDLSATPIMIGRANVWSNSDTVLGDMTVTLDEHQLILTRAGKTLADIDISPWASRQPSDYLADPFIDFLVGEIKYRLVVDDATIAPDASPATTRTIQNMTAVLFASQNPWLK